MFKNRLFNVFVAMALVIVVALTVREAVATTVIECTSLPSRYSLRTEYVDGMWVPYTDDGPAGVDGGLIDLMSNYRTCSR
jgi:hypothetical protein